MDPSEELPPLLIDTRESAGVLEAPAEPTPVTIVTGYLGSGKSTLLKHLTTTNLDKRIAVVLNEFGQTSDIERSLTVKRQNEDGSEVEEWVELDNGCMCCTAKDAGVSAIEKLMARQGRFDHVIIETSGLADPAPIANMFWLDDALMARVKLDSVVSVVDVRTIDRSLDDGPVASLQLACSDVVLVNKCDTATPEEVAAVERRVQSINGAARVIRTQYGEVGAGQILGLDAYSTRVDIGSAQNTAGAAVCSDCEAGDATHEHTHAQHNNHGLSTAVLSLDAAALDSDADLARFEEQLQHILWAREVDGQEIEVHRAKGKFHLHRGTPQAVTKIVQGVRETYEIVDVPYEPEGSCKLVLIGRSLEPVRSKLEAMFLANKGA